MNSDQKLDEIIRLLTEISRKLLVPETRWHPPQTPTPFITGGWYYCGICNADVRPGHMCSGTKITCTQPGDPKFS